MLQQRMCSEKKGASWVSQAKQAKISENTIFFTLFASLDVKRYAPKYLYIT